MSLLEGKYWFSVESKSFEILTEIVKGKVLHRERRNPAGNFLYCSVRTAEGRCFSLVFPEDKGYVGRISFADAVRNDKKGVAEWADGVMASSLLFLKIVGQVLLACEGGTSSCVLSGPLILFEFEVPFEVERILRKGVAGWGCPWWVVMVDECSSNGRKLQWARILVRSKDFFPSSVRVVVGDLCFSIPLWWEIYPRVAVVQSRRLQQQKVGDEVGAASCMMKVGAVGSAYEEAGPDWPGSKVEEWPKLLETHAGALNKGDLGQPSSEVGFKCGTTPSSSGARFGSQGERDLFPHFGDSSHSNVVNEGEVCALSEERDLVTACIVIPVPWEDKSGTPLRLIMEPRPLSVLKIGRATLKEPFGEECSPRRAEALNREKRKLQPQGLDLRENYTIFSVPINYDSNSGTRKRGESSSGNFANYGDPWCIGGISMCYSSRLDRFLVSEEWKGHFSGLSQKLLLRPPSDHAPILLDEGGSGVIGYWDAKESDLRLSLEDAEARRTTVDDFRKAWEEKGGWCSRISTKGDGVSLWKVIRCGGRGSMTGLALEWEMQEGEINDWELGEVEGLVRRLQGHMVSGGCYSLAMANRGKLFWQILLLLSWLLSEGFPHKLGVESLGVDEIGGGWEEEEEGLKSCAIVSILDFMEGEKSKSFEDFELIDHVEQKRKHAMRPLPQTLLHRVSELAIIHPYPKGSNSKLPHVGHVTSAMLPTTSKDAPSSLGRRLVPRKNCT
ncbi:hypothetical protein CK203_044793 [Vitis vinifera]|uniref:DUF4283 domain-containing protein n=1 Tax=Vitis vinifera TaxID=29760 RepID=A0A438H6M3_VITVI|nr:hypothetical protein CK203_044793 [Vitis vinifera]